MRKNVRNINEFKSGQKIYLPIVFEINVNDVDLSLHYDSNSVLNIVTPIKLQIDNLSCTELKNPKFVKTIRINYKQNWLNAKSECIKTKVN